MEVVQLRTSPKVSDIPGMMRKIADDIESGETPAESVLCLIPVDGDFPMVFGWGEHLGDLGNIGLLELAKAWFVANRIAR